MPALSSYWLKNEALIVCNMMPLQELHVFLLE
jgi:hypothetical protein